MSLFQSVLPKRVFSQTGAVSSRRAVRGLLAVMLVLTPAGFSQPAIALDALLPPPQTVSVPVDDAQIEKALTQLDRLTRDLMERSGVPGVAVAVTWKGRTVFVRGYGVRKAGAPDVIDADTVFQIASVSKSVAGSVVAAKVGDGTLGWDDPVRKYLPDFRLSDERISSMVTFGDLFAHRSGLPAHAGDDLEDLGYDRAEVLKRLRLLPLGKFRLDYAYTNFGLTAAAEAVAMASGTDWATLSEEVLYRPLGMERTSSRFKDFMARRNRAFPHVRQDGAFEALYQRQPDAQSPAGGVSSSVNDLAKWMALVLAGGEYDGKRLIGAEALLKATTAQVIASHSYAPDARPGLYGYGFNVGVEPSGRVTVSHSGGFALGAGTNFLLVPALDLGIVVLTNAEPIGLAESLTRSFIDVVEYGAPTRDWLQAYGKVLAPLTAPFGKTVGEVPPANSKAAHPLASYAGTYENAYFGPLTIAEQPSGLELTIGPEHQRYALSLWNDDSYTFEPRGENAPAGSRSMVRFETGSQGTVKSAWIEFFDENGLGTFEKR